MFRRKNKWKYRSNYGPERRKFLKKIIGYSAASVPVIGGLICVGKEISNKLKEDPSYDKSEVKIVVDKVGQEDPILVRDEAGEGEGYAYLIGADADIDKDNKGINYKFGTKKHYNALVRNVNVGDTLILRGTIKGSDLEKAARDTSYVVPVTNAGIRTLKGENPLLN